MTASHASHAKDVLYFDGACGMCQRTTRTLRRLDWCKRLAFQDMTQLEENELPVSLERAMQGIPMRTRNGRVLVGFAAVRRAMVQTPLGAVPALFAYVPGVSHVGAWMYGWIATHRVRDIACERPAIPQ